MGEGEGSGVGEWSGVGGWQWSGVHVLVLCIHLNSPGLFPFTATGRRNFLMLLSATMKALAG